MPTYVYRCDDACGDFTQRHPMADIPDAASCPECGHDARRVIGSPALGVGDSPAMRLHDATRSTADSPTVVTSVPGQRRKITRVSSNPLHRKLPRP
ncbi:zinc ribbon domain-containing protein [Gordonia sp. ABSL11-1]|uniref:FmdB family zinc ribbon protein n=1 Tax=Gordonia sp. ABSL11-1 TaxID=3053924 RepID=UPI00257253F1|nr:zinc ribbon domain-containing protein [Gordonia sp. ABSL11-1]MDL9946949.1 zinc ribbon domain-containing protein [Gordonia sp. ABSL11-1]